MIVNPSINIKFHSLVSISTSPPEQSPLLYQRIFKVIPTYSRTSRGRALVRCPSPTAAKDGS
jgi:hypothetical protein